ncbi:tol-pal system protein YbgF [Thioalkalivibrio sp.]|uniref:tol-pal system protein YbgF n=1 Tax=Thioalkalivibrio sp. TaxID=2093813 RepID=UPI0035615C99
MPAAQSPRTGVGYRKLAALLLGIGLLLPAPAIWAQSNPPVATQHQLQTLEMRVERVERLLDSGVLTEMLRNVDDLQSEVRQLRGQVEQLENELRNIRARQRDQFRNLDERIGLVEGDLVAERSPMPEALPVDEPLPDADEQESYETAFNRLMGGDYEDAIRELERFMERYPDGVYSANALYWLAEAKYARGDYEAALIDFEAVRDRFPDSEKAADALLKLGYSHFELGNTDQARAALEQVLEDYPGTTLSRLAQDRLRRLDGQ